MRRDWPPVVGLYQLFASLETDLQTILIMIMMMMMMMMIIIIILIQTVYKSRTVNIIS